MSQVPIQRTPIAMSDFARAVMRAWRADEGDIPSKASVGVLWAQHLIETGGSACWNWNIANAKVTPAQVASGVDWFDLPGTWEIIKGHRVVLPEGDPGRRFRAFPSLVEAMPWHLNLLKGRFAPCWPAVRAGDVSAFARLLKAGRDGKPNTGDDYFTASAEDYAAGMSWHYRKWMASTVYENVRDELEMLQERPTEPQLPDDPDPESTKIVDFAVIHPRVPLRGDADNDDDPEAA